MRPVDILLKLKEMGFPVSRSIVSARLSELKKEGLVADVSNLGPAPRYEATNKGVEYLTKLTALLDDEELGEFSE
jgi:DNA-binding HxlR family transcriptional regulator